MKHNPNRLVISTKGMTYVFDKPCLEVVDTIESCIQKGDVFVNGVLVQTYCIAGRVYWGLHHEWAYDERGY
jgi:hypothetical protein